MKREILFLSASISQEWRLTFQDWLAASISISRELAYASTHVLQIRPSRSQSLRGHGAHVGATQLTESLLLVTSGFLRDQVLIFSAAKNHFHPNRSLTDKDSGFTCKILAYEIATPTPLVCNSPSRPMNSLVIGRISRFRKERFVQFFQL